MTSIKDIVLPLVICSVIATPLAASAQTPTAQAPAETVSAVPALDRIPAPVPAPRVSLGANGFTWEGMYGGFTLGYGGSISDTAFNPLPDNLSALHLQPTTLNPAPMGWTYGFHLGWNGSVGTGIYGVEYDFNWSTIDGDTEVSPFLMGDGSSFDGTLHADQNLGWLTSIRGRYGKVIKNKCMVYATGGVAWAEINNFAETDSTPDGIIVYSVSHNERRFGWTIGGGIEGGFNERWGWRGQYLYYDFGSPSAVADPVPANPPFQIGHTFKNATNSFTFGVNYRF